ncbi:HNH endonuclease [Spirochaeta dissipatitropha]
MRNNKDIIFSELLKTGKWGERDILVGIRAKFHCEYCGKYLLDSVESYKEWNIDHIIPKNAGGKDSDENLALSCRTCNVSLKSRVNLFDEKTKLSRDEKILVIKKYVSEKRKDVEKEITKYRNIVEKT